MFKAVDNHVTIKYKYHEAVARFPYIQLSHGTYIRL